MLNRKDIIKKISECFLKNGVDLDAEILDSDTDIVAFYPDSITFISIIISLEEEFSIEIPDEYLNLEHFGKGNIIIDMIEKSIK